MLLVFLALLSFTAKAGQLDDLKDYTAVVGCSLYALNGVQLKAYPGSICEFLPNGDFISADLSGLSYYDAKKELKWKVEGKFHHQISLTHKQDRILALTSYEKKDPDGITRRYDRALIIGMDGKVLHSLDFDFAIKQANLKILNHENNFAEQPRAKLEGSHLNSFYEIPPYQENLVIKAPWTTENLILNGNGHGLWIYDSTLSKLEKFIGLPGTKLKGTHDVQVFPNGKLIFFNNYAEEATNLNRYSTVDELEIPSLKRTFQFRAKPAATFYSRFGGSVQKLSEDLLLFTSSFQGVYVYSRSGQEFIWSSILYHAPLNQPPRYVQKITLVDLRSFFRHAVQE